MEKKVLEKANELQYRIGNAEEAMRETRAIMKWIDESNGRCICFFRGNNISVTIDGALAEKICGAITEHYARVLESSRREFAEL